MPTPRVLALALTAASFGALAGGATASDAERANVDRYRQHVFTLSNPWMGGRFPGTEGIEHAAQYMEYWFDRAGLTPAFPVATTTPAGDEVLTPRASWRQPMPYGSEAEVTGSAFTIGGVPQTHDEDYAVFTASGSGFFEGPVAFVGYSIVSGRDGYMSYGADADLSGHAALMLRFEPMDDEGNSLWSDTGWSGAAGLSRKVSAAARRGAEAVLMVNPVDANDDRAGTLRTTSGGGARGYDIPVIMISPAAAARLTADAGLDWDRLKADANESGGVTVFDESTEVEITTTVERLEVTTSNIGGVLEGKGDLAGEYIVIGGHYDHVGLGFWGSTTPESAGSIHAGADDNASGTSGVLLAAELLAERYAALPEDADARSILFMGFTAEESGLNGSRYYVDNPIVPIESHYLMLNMDMIGRLRNNTLEMGGIDTGEGLKELAYVHFDASGLDVEEDLSVGSGRSDHANFDAKGVPNMFFFTGLHDDYHGVRDTAEKILPEGSVRIVQTVTEIAFDAATRPETMPYTETQTRAAIVPRGRPKVRVGVIPGNYSGAGGGILIDEISDGGAAQEAGVLAGDRIVTWNGDKVEDVQAWMPMLMGHEPGDEVEIEVIRGDQTVKLTLKLKGAG